MMEPDVVEVGRLGANRPRWPVALLAIGALTVGALVVAHHHTAKAHSAGTTPVTTTPAFVTPTSPVSVYSVGHPLLGVTARWDLFGLGNGVVVRVQPALGRVTVTALPGGGGGAAESLLALPGRVVVRPVNSGRSYSVTDGASAVPLSGRLMAPLSHAGAVLPGPVLGQEWVQTSPADEDATVMTLIGTDGRSVGGPVHVPGDGYLSGDGGGHLIYTTRVNNVYYATAPGRWRVTTTGQLLAIGADRVVTVEHGRPGYRTVVTEVPSGSRLVFAAHGFVADPVLGPVSPDGRTAAVLSGSFHATRVVLVDLRTGVERNPSVAASDDGSSLAWSPDGRWLLAVTAAGRVVAIDARTATVHSLGVTLPPLTQLIIRPAR